MWKYRMSWKISCLEALPKKRSWFQLPSDPSSGWIPNWKIKQFSLWTLLNLVYLEILRNCGMEKAMICRPRSWPNWMGNSKITFLGNFGRIQPTKPPLMLMELSFQNNELHKNRSWDGPTLQLDCLRLGSKFPWLGRSRHKLKMPDNTCCFNCKICVRVCTPKTPLVFWIQTCAHFLGSFGGILIWDIHMWKFVEIYPVYAPWNVDQSMTSFRDFSRGRPSWFGREIPWNNAVKYFHSNPR